MGVWVGGAVVVVAVVVVVVTTFWVGGKVRFSGGVVGVMYALLS